MPRDDYENSTGAPPGMRWSWNKRKWVPKTPTPTRQSKEDEFRTPESVLNDPVEYSPKSNEFWKKFVAEWQSAKEDIRLNDQFKKDVMEPAFQTYQNRLAGLSGEPTFKPINLKMGDFETSFMPQRAANAAQGILSSEIAKADIMQPKKADMDYLSQLMNIAQYQQNLKNQINITQNQKDALNRDDQGTWLDAIGDVIKVGTGGVDLVGAIGKLF